MRQLLIIILFFVSIGSFAQRNVPGNVRDLDIALVNRDTGFLKEVLHEELSYGHSNGWVETKADLLEHLFSGKLTYKSIESNVLTIDQADKVTIVRAECKVKYVLDGKEGELKLHVMQVWVLNKNGWQLLSRQSTKLN